MNKFKYLGMRDMGKTTTTDKNKSNEIACRHDALKWWNLMTFENQFYKTIEWLSSQNRDTTERHPHNLTGREIEEIYEMNLLSS